MTVTWGAWATAPASEFRDQYCAHGSWSLKAGACMWVRLDVRLVAQKKPNRFNLGFKSVF